MGQSSVHVPGEKDVCGNRRLVGARPETVGGDQVGRSSPRRLGPEPVAVDKPAPEIVANGTHDPGDAVDVVALKQLHCPAHPVSRDDHVPVDQRDQVAAGLTDAEVPLEVRVTDAGRGLGFHDEQPRVADVPQGRPG